MLSVPGSKDLDSEFGERFEFEQPVTWSSLVTCMLKNSQLEITVNDLHQFDHLTTLFTNKNHAVTKNLQ